MVAILAAIEDGRLQARGRVVISNNAGAHALTVAQRYRIPAFHLSQTVLGPDRDLDDTVVATLVANEVEIVILSGYLRKLGPKTLNRFRGRILNIHPSLLPKFGGKGMHGIHVHEAVIASKEPTSGASVHLVESEYDTGPVIARRAVEVGIDDTPADLARRVNALEPSLFVDTLRGIAEGTIRLPSPCRESERKS